MADYSTQGDPNQMAQQGNYEYSQNNSTTKIQNTNNYLIPDGSDRCIHDIQDKTLHISVLENGHNAYLVELPDLKSLLHTSRYLMDETTGQFYAVFGNSYQCMCTIPRLLHTWEPGQLIDELAATRCDFGCMGPTGPTPATQTSQPCLADQVSTAYNEDIIPDLTTQKPLPRTVPTIFPILVFQLRYIFVYLGVVPRMAQCPDVVGILQDSEPTLAEVQYYWYLVEVQGPQNHQWWGLVPLGYFQHMTVSLAVYLSGY